MVKTTFAEESETDVRHIVLLGDSIFDNGVYVPGEPAVIDQLRLELPKSWQATLLARDGDVIADVTSQLDDLPSDATDLVVSVGGNDAIGHAHLLERAESANDLNGLLADVLPKFQQEYTAMLKELQQLGRSTLICTIYDQCPFAEPRWRELVPTALGVFNDCIEQEADRLSIPIIELRDICTDPEDYSGLSPIEPSSAGGMKIVSAILGQLDAEVD